MLKLNLGNYLTRHLQVSLYSLGLLWRQPVASIMTIMVIGIALALPAGLYVILKNVEQVSGQWDDASQISLFLSPATRDSRGNQLAQQLSAWPDIKQATYQSPQASLEEFRELSGLDELIDTLPRNPLPAVIIIEPTSSNAEALETLRSRLQEMQEVDLAQLEMEWLQRLHRINKIGERGITILAVLLSISVLLVIGNTIRLSIMNRQTEIRVIKLVGGTNAFVRRPFLYTGFWYGFLGGIVAWLTLEATLFAISSPVNQLASLYESHFKLNWLSAETFSSLLLFGSLLGVLGALIAVTRHLNAIEPR